VSRTVRRYRKTGRKTLRDGRGHGWNWSTPSWWNNLFHTHKQRAEVRQKIRIAMLDVESSNSIVWPLAKKPHHYFW